MLNRPAQGAGRRTPRKLAGLAVVAGLVLSGCGVERFDHAATVDGHVITNSDLHEVAEQYAQLNPMPIDQVLSVLILLPSLDEAAYGTEAVITSYDLTTWAQAQGLTDPTPELYDFIRGMNYIQSQEVLANIDIDGLSNLDVTVNPRYGTWDSEQFMVVADQPEWIDSADEDAN